MLITLAQVESVFVLQGTITESSGQTVFEHGCGKYESPGQKCPSVHTTQTPIFEYNPIAQGSGLFGHTYALDVT